MDYFVFLFFPYCWIPSHYLLSLSLTHTYTHTHTHTHTHTYIYIYIYIRWSLNKHGIFLKKAKYTFKIFSHKYKFCIVWNWFIPKIMLILQNTHFEAIPNGGKSEYSRIEQRSVISFRVIKKCKSCNIYRRMCDVNGEADFSKKNICKWDQQGFPLWAWIEKRVHGPEIHWLSGKKTFWVQWLVKKVILIVFW